MFEDEYGDFSLKKFLIVVGLITGFFCDCVYCW